MNQAIRNLLSNEKSGNTLKGLKKSHCDSRLAPPMVRHATHVFTKSVAYKDATYKGSWLRGQLHGLYVLLNKLVLTILVVYVHHAIAFGVLVAPCTKFSGLKGTLRKC